MPVFINKYNSAKLFILAFLLLVPFSYFARPVQAASIEPKPRVLFMIAEQDIGQKFYRAWWWGKTEYKAEVIEMSAAETAMQGLFIDKGFEVVDISGSTGVIDIPPPQRVADLTQDSALLIGRKLNADIIVYGKVLARAEGKVVKDSPAGLFMADITVQAIRTADGATLGSAKGRGTSRHISNEAGSIDAITKAAQEAGQKLASQINDALAKATEITLYIKGLRDFNELSELKDLLRKRINGLLDISQKSFAEGGAELILKSRASAERVADEISKLEGFRIEVTGVSENSIEANINAGQD